MSTRRADRTIDQRVAKLEEWVRRLQGDTAVAPTDPRFLYAARGDLLVADGPVDPVPLSIGAVADVLTMDPDPQWEAPDRIRQSLISVKGELIVGNGAASASTLAPLTDGLVLTADSTRPTGIRWV